MNKIKFGTDGWRAIIAKDYTTDNVSRVSIAVAAWLHSKYKDPVVVWARLSFCWPAFY